MSDRPIIVLGCPRSGTTMLQLMLHSHPRIAIPPENRFVLPAYAARRRFGDLERAENRRKLGEFIAVEPRRQFKDLGLDRRETVERVAAGPPTLGSGIGLVLKAYAERFDRPRWGDKRPSYYASIPILLRLFPDAQIVHIVRDPRDCLASLKRVPWWKGESSIAISNWARAVDYTRGAARRRRGLLTEVSYERLVADPDTELRRLCSALGEEYEPAMAEPQRTAEVAVPAWKHWHAQTHVAPTTASVGRWANELESWELGLCEQVLGARMARFGYELTGAPRPPAKRVARYIAVDRALRVRRARRLARDLAKRPLEPNPVAALLTSGQLAAAGAAGTPVRTESAQAGR